MQPVGGAGLAWAGGVAGGGWEKENQDEVISLEQFN